MLGLCEQVTAWGPYQICPRLYERALCRKRELDSGKVRYKFIDVGYVPSYECNCIHGLTFIERNLAEP